MLFFLLFRVYGDGWGNEALAHLWQEQTTTQALAGGKKTRQTHGLQNLSLWRFWSP